MKPFKFILIFITILLFNACDKNNPIDITEVNTSIQSISGKISGWHLGSDKEVILLGNENPTEVFARSKVDSEGNFNLTKLSAPTKIVYNTVNPLFINERIISNTVTCSDSSAMEIWGYLCIVNVGDTSNNVIGRIFKGKFSNTTKINYDSFDPGDFTTAYICTDKDVNVSGRIESKYLSAYDNKQYHIITDYNLSYKKGWNKEVSLIKAKEITSDSIYVESSCSNAEQDGGYWIYHDGH